MQQALTSLGSGEPESDPGSGRDGGRGRGGRVRSAAGGGGREKSIPAGDPEIDHLDTEIFMADSELWVQQGLEAEKAFEPDFQQLNHWMVFELRVRLPCLMCFTIPTHAIYVLFICLLLILMMVSLPLALLMVLLRRCRYPTSVFPRLYSRRSGPCNRS